MFKSIFIFLFSLSVIAATRTQVNTLRVKPQSAPSAAISVEGDVYYDSTGKILKLYDGSSFTNIGQGSGGAFSIITGNNSDFEASVGDWLNYDDGASATPTDSALGGTGGSPTVISIARDTTAANLLNGDAVGLISKTAADGQGEGVSVSSLAVPTYFRGKEMQVRIKYKTLTGYVNDYYRVFAVAQDGASAGLINVLNNAGGDGSLATTPTAGLEFIGSVTMPSDATLVRLVIHGTSTDATAFDVAIDDVKWEEISGVNGPVITEWIDYTATLSDATNVSVQTTKYQRIGDSIVIAGEFAWNGAGAGTAFTVSLPPGLSIDTTKIHGITSQSTYLGGAQWLDAGVGRIGVNVNYESTTVLRFEEITASAGPLVGTGFANTDILSFKTNPIPITELDSGAIISTAQANVSTSKVLGSHSTATHTSTGNFQSITYTEDTDETNSFDGTTFTAPSPGFYQVNATVAFAANATGVRAVQALINGATQLIGDQVANAGGADVTIVNYSQLLNLAQDDTVVIQGRQSSGGNLNYSTSFGKFSIEKRPDLTVFGVNGAHERIESTVANAAYGITAGQWGDFTSIILTPGTWRLSSQFVFSAAGGSITTTNIFLGISTTAGNSSTGLILGDNESSMTPSGLDSGDFGHIEVITWEQTITSTTTYYMKTHAETSITNLNAAGKLVAERLK